MGHSAHYHIDTLRLSARREAVRRMQRRRVVRIFLACGIIIAVFLILGGCVGVVVPEGELLDAPAENAPIDASIAPSAQPSATPSAPFAERVDAPSGSKAAPPDMAPLVRLLEVIYSGQLKVSRQWTRFVQTGEGDPWRASLAATHLSRALGYSIRLAKLMNSATPPVPAPAAPTPSDSGSVEPAPEVRPQTELEHVTQQAGNALDELEALLND